MSLDDFINSEKNPTIRKKKQSQKSEQKSRHEKSQKKENHDHDLEISKQKKIELLRAVLQNQNIHLDEKQNRKGENKEIETHFTEFLPALEHFVKWVKGRTYIRGDIETVKQMIRNLVKLDKSLQSSFNREPEWKKFMDLTDFLKKVKEHDSLHPDEAILTKQQYKALHKKKKGEKLSSTDYRHLRLLKERILVDLRKVPYLKYLEKILDVKY